MKEKDLMQYESDLTSIIFNAAKFQKEAKKALNDSEYEAIFDITSVIARWELLSKHVNNLKEHIESVHD